MTIDLNLETLNSLGKTAEAVTPAIQDEGVGDTFEQRALYWVGVVNQMFSSFNQLLDNIKSNPLIAQQLSDKLGFKFPTDTGQQSIPAQILSPTPLTMSKTENNPLFSFMQKFFSHLLSMGLGDKTMNELFEVMIKKIKDSGMGDMTIKEMDKRLVEDKDFLNNMFKKFTDKKDGNKPKK